MYINVYASGDGRTEWNHGKHKAGRRWSTAILTHAEYGERLNDRNFDSFLDTPLKNDFVIRNEWKYKGDRGLRGEYSITGIQMQHMAGQKAAFENTIENPFGILSTLLANDSDSLWTTATEINRVELRQNCHVFPDKE